MESFLFVLSLVGGLWGLLVLIGFSVNDAKCSACKMYGEKQYMVEIAPKDYRHYSCRFDAPYSYVKVKSTRHTHGSE